MIGERIEFTGTLTNTTPLHIGSGTAVAGEAGTDGDPSPQIGDVMRDANGRPFIPGSSLKGVLKRAVETSEAIFGGLHPVEEGKTVAGKLIVGAAYALGAQSNETKHVRVAINSETGVAEKARLFSRYTIDPGSEFQLRMAVPAQLSEGETVALAQLFRALLDGVGIGKSTRQGEGCVKLKNDTFKAERRGYRSGDLSPDWLARIKAAKPPLKTGRAYRLSLTTRGPFLISDPDNAPVPDPDDKAAPQIVGLKAHGSEKPALTGSTFLGALREKSAWLERMKHPTERTEFWDQPGRAELDMDFLSDAKADPSQLTITQRLFGVTGWRGLLQVEALRLKNNPQIKPLTSVKIDRFSASPVDNALFTCDAWIAPEFAVDLRFVRRSYSADLQSTDEAFLDDLIANLTDDIWGGLDLGFAKGRGFGHFDVKERGDD